MIPMMILNWQAICEYLSLTKICIDIESKANVDSDER